MRLIDADALKRKFRCSYNGDCYAPTCKGCRYNVLLDEDIDEAPTVEPKHGEWIPCSERLPDKKDHYLMTVISRGKIRTFVGLFMEDIGDFEMFRYSFGEVLAWMPLPEPYKEGEP